MGRRLQPYRSRANRPPPCSRATVKRDIGRPVACVCLAISPAVFRRFLLACKTMYRSSAGVVPCGYTTEYMFV
ncbi:hypothetical protein TNCV_3120081 [Trichonephila clavipes]|uniref:Uncharacterized protein n=1 Tax=Trichonephila clavipes TaxID=2585209 RepID=A0A8X6W9G7_TRICX|nr:hypothetical protein TNCV_3120081 [Trichonephila clavipes]